MHRPDSRWMLFRGNFSEWSACAFVRCTVLVFLCFSSLVSSDSLTSIVSPERQVELEYLLQQDCGSCHGLTLTGGLGSPLTTKALTAKSPEYLIAVIREGIPNSPMPAWSIILNDVEIQWLVERLMNGVVQP